MRPWLAAAFVVLTGCAASSAGLQAPSPMLAGDDFRHGLGAWAIEAEAPARIRAEDGVLDIDAAKGVSLWFKRALSGPVEIVYEAQAVAAGGANDQVSDLNAFWMADDPRAPGELLARARTGRFEDYDALRLYYLGLGGNRNTTTRFRRYAGAGVKPLLPEHDRRAPEDLLRPNVWQGVRLVADGPRIEVFRDGRRLFALCDPQPYTRGWFALRTTFNHMRVRGFRVRRPYPAQAPSSCAGA